MKMQCVKCDHTFQLHADHQGFANVCPSCSDGDVDRVMAKVAWSSKHVMEMEITSDIEAAKRFNNAQRRFGAGVTMSIIAPKEGRVGSEARKDGSGAESGALYRSRLGEKRTVK